MFDWLRRLLSASPRSGGPRVEATGDSVAAAGDIINSPIIIGLGEEGVERRHRERMNTREARVKTGIQHGRGHGDERGVKAASSRLHQMTPSPSSSPRRR
jgi:hypothetical protein